MLLEVLIKYLIGFKKMITGNTDKCHLIISSKTLVGIDVSNITIISQKKVKLLEIYMGNRLNFDYHISQLCKKTGRKLHPRTRVFKYMSILECKLIANAFIMSQFSYSPLIWMFHSRAMEHRTNRIHERTLRLIYPNQHQVPFKELLKKPGPLAYTRKNETCKAKHKISPEVVNSLYEFTNKNYNLRNA